MKTKIKIIFFQLKRTEWLIHANTKHIFSTFIFWKVHLHSKCWIFMNAKCYSNSNHWHESSFENEAFYLFSWTIRTKMEKCLLHIWVYKNITLTFFSLWSMSFEEAEDVICANFFKMNFFYPPRSFIHINTKWFSDPTLA